MVNPVLVLRPHVKGRDFGDLEMFEMFNTGLSKNSLVPWCCHRIKLPLYTYGSFALPGKQNAFFLF